MGRTNFFISNFESKDARRLLVKILFFIPALLLVLTVNLCLDPEGLYRKTVDQHQTDEYIIARTLVTGSIAVTRPSINDRLLRKYMIENTAIAPDIVVLGSSHSAWVGGNIFPNKRVVNDSVQYAVLADYLGIFEGYAKKNLYPQRVICVLDPQLIGYPVPCEKWLSIKEDTYGMLDRLGGSSQKIKEPVMPQAWFNIFSFSYFQGSMYKYWYDLGQHFYFINEYIDRMRLIYLKDGRWALGVPSMSGEQNKRRSPGGINHWDYAQALGPMKPDKDLEDVLEKFIRYLMGHHVRVTLCLLPVHPDVYKSLIELRKRQGALDIMNVENYYHGLAQKLNLEIIGSYDPAACNLTGNDFLDGDHIRFDVLERMLKRKNSQCSMPD